MGHGPMHMSAADGKPRQTTPQATPKLRTWQVDYRPTCHRARFVFRNIGDEKLDSIRCHLLSQDGVTSIGREDHVLVVRAEGGKDTAMEIKEAVEHMLATL